MRIHTAVYGIDLLTDFAFSWPIDTPERKPRCANVDLSFTCIEEAPVTIDWHPAPTAHSIPGVTDKSPDVITYHALGR